MKEKRSSRSCFLSAPFGIDTRLLERELARLGYSISDGRTLAPSVPLIAEIRKRISQSDLVCVVAPAALSANAAFELGLAVGVAKTVVVFAPLGAAIPSDLAGITYCSAALDDRTGIRRYLEAFLAHGRSRLTPDQPSAKRNRLSPAQSKSLRKRLAHESGVRFEQLVKELFEASGYIASEGAGPEDRGVDFAVWADRLQHSFGNPIIVQVKDRLRGPLVDDAEHALRVVLQRTGGRLGLLIYRTADPAVKRPVTKSSWPLVMSLDVSELIRLLERGQFESRLIEIRNRAAHGIEER
jgi:hypothetical protein